MFKTKDFSWNALSLRTYALSSKEGATRGRDTYMCRWWRPLPATGERASEKGVFLLMSDSIRSNLGSEMMQHLMGIFPFGSHSILQGIDLNNIKKEQSDYVPLYSGTKLYLTICSCNFFICGIKRIAYIVLTREKRWKREDDDLSIQKMQVQQWNVIMFFLSGMWSDCLQTASLHIFRQDFLFYSSNGIL